MFNQQSNPRQNRNVQRMSTRISAQIKFIPFGAAVLRSTYRNPFIEIILCSVDVCPLI